MAIELSRNWWALAIRGVAAIIFGVLAFFFPGLTLLVLALLYGAYALVDGIFAVAAAMTGHFQPGRWWAMLLEGILGIAVGLITFFWTGLTVVALLYLIAFWAIVTGVLEIVAAFRLRHHVQGEWALGLSGLLSVLFGVLLVVWPGPGLLTIAYLIGAYAILFGVLMLVVAFRLRTWGRTGAGADLAGPSGQSYAR